MSKPKWSIRFMKHGAGWTYLVEPNISDEEIAEYGELSVGVVVDGRRADEEFPELVEMAENAGSSKNYQAWKNVDAAALNVARRLSKQH